MNRNDFEDFLARYHAAVWEAAEGFSGVSYDEAGKELAKEFLARFDTSPAEVSASLGDSESFKNFHGSLCARFGYTHDEKDWRRDLVSLEEHIARKIEVPDIVLEVLDELQRAIAKFPTWPTDPLHAVGVLNEEVGELNKAVLQQVYEPHKNRPADVSIEARQAAAMTLRFLASLDDYDWRRGHQHQQTKLGKP